jgi:hypothetical protein
MQEQGVRSDDPEFLKAQSVLIAIQRQQAFKQKQRMAQQQHQQQQVNGATPEAANGSHGKSYIALSIERNPKPKPTFRANVVFQQVAPPQLPQLPPLALPLLPRQWPRTRKMRLSLVVASNQSS